MIRKKMAKKFRSASKTPVAAKKGLAATRLAVLLTVQTVLFVLYWRYMNSLATKGCACALTPRFQNIRAIFKAVVILYYSLIALVMVCRFCSPAIFLLAAGAGSILAIILSVLVVRWWFEMRAAHCACSDAWEKDLWAFLSAYHVATILVGFLGAVLAIV
jgi:hypothetical protein